MAEQASRGRAAMADDAALWRQAMRDVAPLRGRKAPALAAAAAPSPAAVSSPQPMQPLAAATEAAALPPLDRFAGLDRATAERLKRGRLPIEARLDLHGMTQEQAYRALAAYIAEARNAGRRCLLVITGRGSGSGVLRAAVPRWLAEPGLRRHLLAIAPAQPRDGGSGALYVLTRRPDRAVVLAGRAASR